MCTYDSLVNLWLVKLFGGDGEFFLGQPMPTNRRLLSLALAQCDGLLAGVVVLVSIVRNFCKHGWKLGSKFIKQEEVNW